MSAPYTRLNFDLPPELEASEPPESRGITRDAVRMLVARPEQLTNSTFGELPRFLEPGDLVVINTSGTIPAAIDARSDDGTGLVLHLSADLGDGTWVVEPRRPVGLDPAGPAGTDEQIDDELTAARRPASGTSERWVGPLPSRELDLVGGGRAQLLSPYRGSERLWLTRLSVEGPLLRWLAAHGRPIRYHYVPRPWPLSAYQNVFVTEPGSAEMPSAARPFTADLIMRLVAKGVGVTPIVLHTGVASLEADELPYPERLRVPAFSADRVNATHLAGRRVVAVGTTVVRALESAATPDGFVQPLDGWTDLVITPERGVFTVDGLLTGWHEPEASHLLMLEAVAGRELIERSYDAGLAERYLWHEFGDTHLLLP